MVDGTISRKFQYQSIKNLVVRISSTVLWLHHRSFWHQVNLLFVSLMLNVCFRESYFAYWFDALDFISLLIVGRWVPVRRLDDVDASLI